MNPHVCYMIARERGVELRRAGGRARLAAEVAGRRGGLRGLNPVGRPSAEPSRGAAVVAVGRAIGGAR
jgi:hypothetical protein